MILLSKLNFSDVYEEKTLSKLHDNSVSLQMDPFVSTTDFIKLGFDLTSCMDTMSEAFGCILFADVSFCIIVSIISIYFTPLIFEAIVFDEQNTLKWNTVKLSFGLHCFFISIRLSSLIRVTLIFQVVLFSKSFLKILKLRLHSF